MNIEILQRENIRRLKSYSSARDEFSGRKGIFLDANENALGSAIGEAVNRYPDPRQSDLKWKIAEIKEVRTEQIFLGNGSDEAIDLPMRAFCEPRRDNVILMPPTYGMYTVCAEVNGVEIRLAPLTPEFQIDVANVMQVVTERSKILLICSPNNPSGNLMRSTDIEKLLREFPGIVIIDEAYIDFTTEPSWLYRLDEFENLIVLQTFSKAWGMASLRLGMAFAHPTIIGILNKIKYPYNINGVTQRMALDALERVPGRDTMIQTLIAERERLADRLKQFSFVERVLPSEANFLLARFRKARVVYEKLLERGIVIRDRSHLLHCENCLRITVGTPDENETLLKTLEGIADASENSLY